ncbi:NAD(P)-dependent oxidoreductase [Ralstonia mannitolilytica]|uniref:NAD(P)-dependent oxidoreductase n=1 Tax=Ralstonia mannitolilytica TaxID=105219 RepID=UPI0028F54712|nr:NAD(P)-dependent oxidoreductase [Ralstonia mannitolilytica]CAJ0741964.1 3-hydroxyisobutyrate dehydrogenase [Ralstonia mannitolilytica]
MAEIAFLGLGAMGSRMALNLVRAGHHVTVWNRSPEAASALAAAGAKVAQTPRGAAAGAAFVVAMLRDDAASRQVWLAPETGALAGMAAGAVAIESSTLSPDWVKALGAAAMDKGVKLLEAPVAGSLPQAEAAQLIYLVGGEPATAELAEPVLKAMGAAVHRVGPLGAGALVKLSTNALLGAQLAVLAELIGMLKRCGADAAQALQAVAATPVWSPVATRLTDSMLAGNFAPQFPVSLIEKDFGYAVDAAGSAEAAPVLAAARGVFRDAMSRGLGEANMTSVVRLFTA